MDLTLAYFQNITYFGNYMKIMNALRLLRIKKPVLEANEQLIEKRKNEIIEMLESCKSRFESFRLLRQSNPRDAIVIFGQLISDILNLKLFMDRKRDETCLNNTTQYKNYNFDHPFNNLFSSTINIFERTRSCYDIDQIYELFEELIRKADRLFKELNREVNNLKKSKLHTPLDDYKKLIKFRETFLLVFIAFVLWLGIYHVLLPYLHNVNTFVDQSFSDWIEYPQNQVIPQSGNNEALLVSYARTAGSGGTTGGVYITIPERYALSYGGKNVKVTVYAKKPENNPSPIIRVAYSTNDTGNSGWKSFKLTDEYTPYSFDYLVPKPGRGGADFIGIHADTSGTGKGILVKKVFVELK